MGRLRLALTEPPRVYRRALSARGWSPCPQERGTPPSSVSARCGWCWSTPRRSHRSGRRSGRLRASWGARRKCCAVGCARPSETPVPGRLHDGGARPREATGAREPRTCQLSRDRRPGACAAIVPANTGHADFTGTGWRDGRKQRVAPGAARRRYDRNRIGRRRSPSDGVDVGFKAVPARLHSVPHTLAVGECHAFGLELAGA